MFVEWTQVGLNYQTIILIILSTPLAQYLLRPIPLSGASQLHLQTSIKKFVQHAASIQASTEAPR